jgi:hypothetical protein
MLCWALSAFRLALNRSGKDDFKFSLAANSAINFICHEDGKLNNHPASEMVIKWNFRAALPPLPWLKKH